MAGNTVLIENRLVSAVRAISRYIPVIAVYLFGSQAEGVADRWSDIDLAVFAEDMESFDIQARASIVSKVQKEAGDDLELHFFSAEEYRHPNPGSFASHILKRGIPILQPVKNSL